MKTESEIIKKMDEIVARMQEIRREHPYEDIKETHITWMMLGANSALEWVLKPTDTHPEGIQAINV